MLKSSANKMKISSMFGNRRLMGHLQFLRIHGMNHLGVEQKSGCISEKKLENIWRRANESTLILDATLVLPHSRKMKRKKTMKKGLVDSDSLPLNVSREMLQQHISLKTIKKKLIRRALDMIRIILMRTLTNLLTRTRKVRFKMTLKVIYLATDIEESSDGDEKKGQYTKFWYEFGKSIKLGIIEDAANRNCLEKLLRFESAKSDGQLTSPDQYISRLEPGQKDIFYITGTSKEQLGRKVMRFQNVSKEGLKLGKDSKDKELKESLKELTKRWKALASENMDDMKISNHLADKDIKDLGVKHTAQLMYQTALMQSGFILADPKEFASPPPRMYED
ncbi:hypothetical protein RHMOL_Rhmol06G0028300 [Rhododendron molle]|uniref:Uncharacterized protein n=1 Tax=Rhododendron molle TaxID=49168 RepID=A0ACC0N865_RHOML|nr:hypothetical protein RHMOL_Rhmol06G0028300 [Rhododendron molle]